MLSFPEVLSMFKLKCKAISNMKFLQVSKKIGLYKKVRIYMRDDVFPTKSGIISLYPSKGTKCVCYVENYYFGCYGCAPPRNLLNYLKIKHVTVFLQNIKFRKKTFFVVIIVNIFCNVCFYFQWILKQLF